MPHSGNADECPLTMTDDRLHEVHWFLHQMLEHYHFPDIFRYSVNGFLSAAKAVTGMLTMELERAGESGWMRERRESLKDDPILSAFFVGRDIALHQRQLLVGSRVQIGVFRFNRLKLVVERQISHDQATYEMLDAVRSNVESFLIDKRRVAVGEQIGIRRHYHVSELSESEDVVTASCRVWTRLHTLAADAHSALGRESEPITEDAFGRAHDVESVALLQETDIDPDAPRRWGWE